VLSQSHRLDCAPWVPRIMVPEKGKACFSHFFPSITLALLRDVQLAPDRKRGKREWREAPNRRNHDFFGFTLMPLLDFRSGFKDRPRNEGVRGSEMRMQGGVQRLGGFHLRKSSDNIPKKKRGKKRRRGGGGERARRSFKLSVLIFFDWHSHLLCQVRFGPAGKGGGRGKKRGGKKGKKDTSPNPSGINP